MGTPTNDLYTAPAGTSVVRGGVAGVPAAAMLALISAAAENSWIKANTNTIQSVFPAPGYIATDDGSTGSSSLPSAVIRCWSSFAHDSNRCRLVLYGGGHANYSGNEVYLFNGATRQWQLGFFPTDVQLVTAPAEFKSIDGDLHSPVSAHTYGNNHCLPIIDRFVTFGGAAAHTGGALLIRDSGPTRKVGCFALDLSQAGLGKVAGAAGSNVKHGHSVSLPGADAWAVRDWLLDHPTAAGALDASSRWNHVSTGAAYRQEGGKDVLYKYAHFNQLLWRLEFSGAGYQSDSIQQVMSYNPSNSGWDCAPAIGGNIFLALGGDSSIRLHGWDISTYSGTPTAGFQVPDSGLTGPDKAEWLADSFVHRYGIAYDTINARFLIWTAGGKVFSLTHPSGALTSNWVVTKLRDDTGTGGVDRPQTRAELDPGGGTTNSDTGVLGKFKWAPDLNAVIALQHNFQGNVWIYKPHNWAAPA